MFRYSDFEELKENLGYKTYKPHIGNLGRAIIDSRLHRSNGWLKKQLDEVFKQYRKQKVKKGNDNKK